MFEVVHYSLCGNVKNVCQTTKGLAEVIALELGVRAEDITAKKGLTKDAFVFPGL